MNVQVVSFDALFLVRLYVREGFLVVDCLLVAVVVVVVAVVVAILVIRPP